MSKQIHLPEATITKQQTKPQPTVPLLVGMAEFVNEPSLLDKRNPRATLLNEHQFSTIQRQTFASKIGGIQGNTHLQKQLVAEQSQNRSIKQSQTHDKYQIQTSPNAIQLDDERLADREEDATFTQTRTYETFESEVRRWLARRVLSRTRQAHRERRLAPRGFLRRHYNMFHPGKSISMKVRFHSNGHSFRYLSFIIPLPSEEIRVSLNQPETQAKGDKNIAPASKTKSHASEVSKEKHSKLPQLPDWIWDLLSANAQLINLILQQLPWPKLRISSQAVGIRGSLGAGFVGHAGAGIDGLFVVDWEHRRLTTVVLGYVSLGVGIGETPAVGIVFAYKLTPRGKKSEKSATKTLVGQSISGALKLIGGIEFSVSRSLLQGDEGWMAAVVNVGPQVDGNVSGSHAVGDGVSYDKEGITGEEESGL